MTVTTAEHLEPGVDRHGSGYRVRVKFPRIGRYVETGIATRDAANRRSLELRELRAEGLTPAAAPLEQTLREAADALLARKRVTGRKRPLRPAGLKHWEKSLKPWREGPFADTPLSMLRRDRLEDAILVRAAAHPTSGRNELEALKATLTYAGNRGARFDARILTIDPLRVEVEREGKAIPLDVLDRLVAAAPAYARNLIELDSTVGCRIGELWTLTDDRVDLEERFLFVPAELCKEGRDKWVPLTRDECALLRRQMIARPAGTRLVFPKKQGGPWREHSHFHRLVWGKACRRAADKWRDELGLLEGSPTPFDDLLPKDLRSTAATLMRDAGFSREEAADRLGHADSGKLLDRVYDKGDRLERGRRTIDRVAPDGIRATLAEPARRRSVTPAGGRSTLAGAR